MDLGSGGLLVEAFAARDLVQGVGLRDVIALSTRADIDPGALLGQPASLEVSLADGARTAFAGEISEMPMLGSEGGFARYRIRISHWIWRLAHLRNSRVWQDRSVTDIVDEVFDAHTPTARWRWSEDAAAFMSETPPRSYAKTSEAANGDILVTMAKREGRFALVNCGGIRSGNSAPLLPPVARPLPQRPPVSSPPVKPKPSGSQDSQKRKPDGGHPVAGPQSDSRKNPETLKVSELGLDFIRIWESGSLTKEHLHPYDDNKGFCTIGVGHLIDGKNRALL